MSGWQPIWTILRFSTAIPHFAPATFIPHPQKAWLATAVDIEQALYNPQFVLVDTRSAEQFAGQAVWTANSSLYLVEGQEWVEINGRKMRGRHLPGAIHLHATANQNPEKQ